MGNKYVPYEIAKLAKQKGFAEPVQACYDKCEMLASYTPLFEYRDYNDSAYCISAPTYMELVEWFSKFMMGIEIELKRDDDGYFTVEVKKYGENLFTDHVGYKLVFSTCESTNRYESYNIAFKEAFKLI